MCNAGHSNFFFLYSKQIDPSFFLFWKITMTLYKMDLYKIWEIKKTWKPRKIILEKLYYQQGHKERRQMIKNQDKTNFASELKSYYEDIFWKFNLMFLWSREIFVYIAIYLCYGNLTYDHSHVEPCIVLFFSSYN